MKTSVVRKPFGHISPKPSYSVVTTKVVQVDGIEILDQSKGYQLTLQSESQLEEAGRHEMLDAAAEMLMLGHSQFAPDSYQECEYYCYQDRRGRVDFHRCRRRRFPR